MINYTLKCDKDHNFDSSFASISAYEKLEKAKALECPCCGSHKIERAPMAPAIARGGQASGQETDDMRAAAAEVAKAVEFVRENFADVGDKLPEEVRALYAGDKKAARRYKGKLGLRGEATDAQVRELAEEGLPIGRLNLPKYDA